MSTYTLERLQNALKQDAAIRVITHLQPAGGPGDKVFPPTYEGGLYATEDRLIDGRTVPTVLLDSVQSQANRLEEALFEAIDLKNPFIPLLSVEIPRADDTRTLVTSLQAPHRISDAIFRDSTLEGKPFHESEIGKRLFNASADNATALFECCPTALIFGYWYSQSESFHRPRLARALVSEIVGLDSVTGYRTESRLDPLGITATEKIYQSRDDIWTLHKDKAVKNKSGEPVLFGKKEKAGRPSAILHGNVKPNIKGDDKPGGVTVSRALQTTVLGLPQLRRLRFPTSDGERMDERNLAGRVALAALAVYSVALQYDQGYFLRSRCQLIPKEEPQAEFVGRTANATESFTLDPETARAVMLEAHEKSKAVGLEWKTEVIKLEPSEKLKELVRRSDEKVIAEGAEDAGD